MSDLFMPVKAELPDVIKVAGVCYSRLQLTAEAPTTLWEAVEGEFNNCSTCASTSSSSSSSSSSTNPSSSSTSSPSSVPSSPSSSNSSVSSSSSQSPTGPPWWIFEWSQVCVDGEWGALTEEPAYCGIGASGVLCRETTYGCHVPADNCIDYLYTQVEMSMPCSPEDPAPAHPGMSIAPVKEGECCVACDECLKEWKVQMPLTNHAYDVPIAYFELNTNLTTYASFEEACAAAGEYTLEVHDFEFDGTHYWVLADYFVMPEDYVLFTQWDSGKCSVVGNGFDNWMIVVDYDNQMCDYLDYGIRSPLEYKTSWCGDLLYTATIEFENASSSAVDNTYPILTMKNIDLTNPGRVLDASASPDYIPTHNVWYATARNYTAFTRLTMKMSLPGIDHPNYPENPPPAPTIAEISGAPQIGGPYFDGSMQIYTARHCWNGGHGTTTARYLFLEPGDSGVISACSYSSGGYYDYTSSWDVAPITNVLTMPDPPPWCHCT